MKRRNFIRNVAYGSAAGLTLGGVPLNLLAGNPALKKMAADSVNDKVLVFIQMHGGNDGLNTLIPISQYDEGTRAPEATWKWIIRWMRMPG